MNIALSPVAVRLQKFVDAAEKPGKERATHPFPIYGKSTPLTIVEVPVDLPLFRISNGRTARLQEQYLSNNPASNGIFDEPSSSAAQAVQQSLLYGLAQEADLERILRESGGQHEPLLLNHEGFVLNGNRRLSIFRSTKMVEVVNLCVLPSTVSQEEQSLIEMRLQMAEEGKASYNWLDELLLIDKNINELGMDFDKVAAAMKHRPSEVQKRLRRLAIVREYLSELGFEGQHFQVEGEKQAFETMEKKITTLNKRDPDLVELFTKSAFALIRSGPAGGVSGSIHLRIEALSKNLSEYRKLAESTNDPIVIPAKAEPEIPNPADPLGHVVVSSTAPKISIDISDETSAMKVNKLITLASDRNQTNEQRTVAFRSVAEAATTLKMVKIDDQTLKRNEILAQIEVIQELCENLIQHLTSK